MSDEDATLSRYHGNSGIPLMTGKFRTDLALCNLARLCYEIAKDTVAREHEARKAAKHGMEILPAQADLPLDGVGGAVAEESGPSTRHSAHLRR